MIDISTVTTPFEEDYKYNFLINQWVLENNFLLVIESSIHRTLTKMYEDGVLNLKPKDVRISTEENEEPKTYKDIDNIEISFFKKGEEG